MTAKTSKQPPFSFYEFFSGAGMVRAGLGSQWRCLLANDFDHKKSATYRQNWLGDELRTTDVRTLTPEDVPGCADLSWASFPCQDLSLAGAGAGLKGERSGTFWPFWNLMKTLNSGGRGSRIIVLENVCGALSSHEGKDFVAICDALSSEEYRFGAVVIDAKLFVPQSRPRLFVIAVHPDQEVPDALCGVGPTWQWHTSALRAAFERLTASMKCKWIWWKLPKPPKQTITLSDIIEERPESTHWHPPQETARILEMMSAVNRAKLDNALNSNQKVVGTVYKRTRHDSTGQKTQRAEVRFDGVAGCLRTPAGGSSRQLILVVENNRVRSRLISSRETARLMGLPDTYILPENYNEAYHLTGDGVVVPVVRHLASSILEPVLRHRARVPQAVA